MWGASSAAASHVAPWGPDGRARGLAWTWVSSRFPLPCLGRHVRLFWAPGPLVHVRTAAPALRVAGLGRRECFALAAPSGFRAPRAPGPLLVRIPAWPGAGRRVTCPLSSGEGRAVPTALCSHAREMEPCAAAGRGQEQPQSQRQAAGRELTPACVTLAVQFRSHHVYSRRDPRSTPLPDVQGGPLPASQLARQHFVSSLVFAESAALLSLWSASWLFRPGL